jgi:peptidoglycan/xylan/chitin deacetylase (PgdA/CDA1 family)
MLLGLINTAAAAPGIGTLLRYLTRRTPRIFMFHRFSAARGASATHADELVRFLRIARQCCELLTVTELLAQRDRPGHPKRPLAAITVDDGYRDFYTVAMPILAEQRVPATLYATAGFVDGGLWLWWDALRHLIDSHAAGRTSVELPDRVFATELSGRRSRATFFSEVATYLVQRSNAERAQAVAQLEASAGESLPARPLGRYAAMSWAELAEARDAGIEIGGHTMTHAFLPLLDRDGLRHELDDAKQMVERHLGSRLTTFAYPNGMPYDYTPAVAEAVRSAGFSAALLAHPRPFSPRNRFAIGRWTAQSTDSTLGNVLNGTSALKLALWGSRDAVGEH